MNGEVYFDMTKQAHRLYGKSAFMLKRWQKYDIFTKTGSYVRSENPNANTYASTSVYLYDYVVVSDTWFKQNVVETEYSSSVPALENDYYGFDGTNYFWTHKANTWKNSPNSTINNYVWRSNPDASSWRGRPVYGPDTVYVSPDPNYNSLMATPIYTEGTYFEIVRGYPRNHYYHKRNFLSPDRFPSYGIEEGVSVTQVYTKGRQTVQTTVGENGLGDGSDPVQSTVVSNVDIVKTDNVIYH